jgi:hypothetical protein
VSELKSGVFKPSFGAYEEEEIEGPDWGRMLPLPRELEVEAKVRMGGDCTDGEGGSTSRPRIAGGKGDNFRKSFNAPPGLTD